MSSAIKLVQVKLDVKNKSRANIFNWRGQFTPQFVDYLLDSFSTPDDIIIDPFSGSGTTLLESARRDLSCYGYEINPAAYTMSEFFSFSNLIDEERKEIITIFEQKLLTLLPYVENLPLFVANKQLGHSYKNLTEFSKALLTATNNNKEKILALNTVFLAESNKKLSLRSSLYNSFSYIKQTLLSLPYTKKNISANLGDARTVDKVCPVKGNLIITSPPYINVFNYHQNYRATIESLGFDVLKIAQTEFGANRKNRGNRFKTVIQYCLDIEQALKSFWHSLDKNGLIIVVLGRESKVRGVSFYNGMIVREIVKGMGGFKDIRDFERKFTNKFGNSIKEDIIIFKKDGTPPYNDYARTVALKHLETKLNMATMDVKEDISNAIKQIDTVQMSPVLNLKEMQTFIDAVWYDPDEALKRGSFI